MLNYTMLIKGHYMQCQGSTDGLHRPLGLHAVTRPIFSAIYINASYWLLV